MTNDEGWDRIHSTKEPVRRRIVMEEGCETCKRGHDLNVTGRWHRNGKKGRRRVCTECHRILTGFKGIYKPRKHNGD